MSRVRLGLFLPAVFALAATACTPAVATLTPSGPLRTQSIAIPSGSRTSPAPTAALAPSAAATKPLAPTNLNVTDHSGAVVCPSPDTQDNCHMSDLAWQSTAAAGTWFKIYEAWTGEGGASCLDAQVDESLIVTTKPDVRAAQIYDAIATGGGGRCLWISAADDVGESDQVPALGQ